MANKITGRIIFLSPLETLTARSGTSYQKREVVIERTVFDRNTGQPTTDPNDTPIFRLFGAVATDLNNVSEGDMITVHYDLEGRSFMKDGVKAYFTDVRVFRVETAQKQATHFPEVVIPQQTTEIAVQASIPYAEQPIQGDSLTGRITGDDGLPF